MREKTTKRERCFVNAHCSYNCPNFQIDIANERYGYGIADDMGFEKVSCKECRYNSGKCEDCLFEHSDDCPEYKSKIRRLRQWDYSFSEYLSEILRASL